MAEEILVLEPLGGGGEAVELLWDQAAGTVAGPLAELVRAQAEEARARGYIERHATLYTEADPLTTREGMAMLCLSMLYRCPEGLREALPAVPEEAAGLDY